MKYDFGKIERKWRKIWQEKGIYEPDLQGAKRPFYNLMMFPYPSAEGLHVGNTYAFTGADIYGRKKRMQGYDVFEPIGLDGFGIHSENYALKIGAHPMKQAKVSEKRFYKQLEMIGNGFAWNERLETYDPEYYKWTQWIFIQMFKRGLAYRKKQEVNWCPSCKTVLADEQVISGLCERCSSKVIKKELEQWFFKITAYAERLLKNLEKLNWSERVKIAQKNWIGKSEGALIDFKVKNTDFKIEAFTTRPDTIFGATYLVLAPENPLVTALAEEIENFKEVLRYVEKAKAKKEAERVAEGKGKTGVELVGVRAINPADKKEIPIWVADYVLGHVGTGAIMAVPAHDERDFEFAKKFKLPIRQVVRKPNAPIRSYVMGANNISQKDLESIGVFVKEKTKDGDYKVEIPEQSLSAFEALIKKKMEPGFWNEYIAKEIVFIFKHKDGKIERLVLNDKNVGRIDRLACEFNNEKYDLKDPGNYINGAVARNSWYKPIIVHSEAGKLINSGKFDGMDSEKAKWEITKFVGGTRKVQYRLRDWLISRQRYWGPPIPMIHCEKCALRDPSGQGWQPVPEKDLPVKLPMVKNFRPTGTGKSPLASVKSFYETKCPKCGGKARRETDVSDTFLDSAWYYLRYLNPKNAHEPFDKLRARKWLPVSMYTGGAEHSVLHLLYVRFLSLALHDIGLLEFGKSTAPEGEPFPKFRAHGLLIKEGAKMSKSKGNVINPDEYIEKFGADTLRMYLMFLAPFEQGGDFRDQAILGVWRFLERVWKFANGVKKGGGNAEFHDMAKLNSIHRTIKKVEEDIGALRYNTAISALMILLRVLEDKGATIEETKTFLKLLAPFAPYMTEELWGELGGKFSIHTQAWPVYDREFMKEDMFTLVIQVNGKFRDSVEVPLDTTETQARELALGRENVKKFIGSTQPGRIIYIPKKLINIVV